MSVPAAKRELLDLIGEYWSLAHAEGREGREHDTEDGAAQRTLSRITSLVDQLAPEPAAAPSEGITLHLPTDAQARAVIGALDLYVRMSLGQLEELVYLIRSDEIRDVEGTAHAKDWLHEVEDALTSIKAHLGHHGSSSFGINSPRVSTDAKRCWEAKKVLAQALALKRNPNPKMPGVDYDGLRLLRYTEDPAPSAHAHEAPRAQINPNPQP